MTQKAVFSYLSAYYRRVLRPDFNVFYPFRSALWQRKEVLPEEPGNVADLLDQYQNKIELNGTHEGTGRELAGYNPNCGNPASGLGVLYMMLAGIHKKKEWRTLDQTMIRWVADVMGFDRSANGFFTSGGSISTVVAMMAAREASRVPLAQSYRSVLYHTDTVHNCAEKAIKMVGLEGVTLRRVQHDTRRKMVVSDLEIKIQEDIKNDLFPFMIIGTLGEVNSGAIDPLDEIAAIAAKYDVWFHVDAAYGGFFLVCGDLKDKGRGIELADSVMVDLHKGLFQANGSSVVLFKKGCSHQLFSSMKTDTRCVNSCRHPLEGDSPFRAFPAWFFLNVFGVKHIQNLLSQKIMLCDYLYRYLTLCPGVYVPIKPELSKVLFALEDDSCDIHKANRKTEQLLKALNSDGSVYVSTTVIDERVYIHMCVSSLRSHFREIEYFLCKLKAEVATHFNLVFPDPREIVSPETQNHLERMGEFYNAAERSLSEEQVFKMVAGAAENYRRGVSDTTDNCRRLAECLVPPVDRVMDTINTTNINNNNVRKHPKEIDHTDFDTGTSFQVPLNPRPLMGILKALSLYPPGVQQTRPPQHEDEAQLQQALLEPAVMGHFLETCTSRYFSLWTFTPGGTELETLIPDWLRKVVGFSTNANGVLCDDCRTADILCLATARSSKLSHPSTFERAVVYGSKEALQTVSQPLHVVGMSSCRTEVIESRFEHLDVDSLMTRIQTDLQDKNIPFLVLSISSKDLEARSENLRKLMTFCREREVWVHVSVSDGAPFLLADLGPCPAMKESDLANADSISVDLTDCLCQPQAVAVALVQDHHLMLKAMQPLNEAAYLAKTGTSEPVAYTIELTRPSRSLPIWFAMYLLGGQGLRQHIANLRREKSCPAARHSLSQ